MNELMDLLEKCQLDAEAMDALLDAMKCYISDLEVFEESRKDRSRTVELLYLTEKVLAEHMANLGESLSMAARIKAGEH